MSWLQTRTVTTFHELNPDWSITVCVPSARSVSLVKYIPDYGGFDHFTSVKEMPFVKIETVDVNAYGIREDLPDILRSDILRYTLLHEHGGLWSDFDVLWLKPMAAFTSVETLGTPVGDCGATVCFSHDTHGWHNIGVLMARPYHPLYKNLVDLCREKASALADHADLDHQEFGVRMLDRILPTLRAVQQKYPDVAGVPYATFYPYSIEAMEKLWIQTDLACLNDKVMGVHWFNGHPLSKSFVNGTATSECSMTAIIRQSVVKETCLQTSGRSHTAQGDLKRRVTYHERANFLTHTSKFLQHTGKVLDLGCGIRPMTFFKPSLHVLVEPYREYVEMLLHQYADAPGVAILQNDALAFAQNTPSRSFDSVFLLDVIEHLPKEDGMTLLHEMNRIARFQAVIFTPLGFHEQNCDREGLDGWGLSGTTVQKHRSGWLPEDFPDGWTFHVCEDFHEFNWKGEPTPAFGAFFAIKTNANPEAIPAPLSRQQRDALRFMPALKAEETAPECDHGEVLARIDKASRDIREKIRKMDGRIVKLQQDTGKHQRKMLESGNKPAGLNWLKRKIRRLFRGNVDSKTKL